MILSVPFCSYHFVPYHFVLEPLTATCINMNSSCDLVQQMKQMQRLEGLNQLLCAGTGESVYLRKVSHRRSCVYKSSVDLLVNKRELDIYFAGEHILRHSRC